MANKAKLRLIQSAGVFVLEAKIMRTFGRILSVWGLGVGIVANLIVLYFTFGFYRAAAVTASGTYIRPMGLTALYFGVGFTSMVVGVSVGAIGVTICDKLGDRKGVALGHSGLILSVLPLPLALILFYLVTALFGLKLAD